MDLLQLNILKIIKQNEKKFRTRNRNIKKKI